MISRRELIQTAAACGFASSSWLRLGAESGLEARKHCVLVWLDGGPSHIDTLDPKPNAPGDRGGPLRPIQTSVPGIQVCETLPKLAQLAERCAIIRSMNTKERQHANARKHLHTGYLATLATEFPSVGAVVSHFNAELVSNLPKYVHLGGGNSHGCGAGFLGASHSPLKVTDQIPYLRSRVPASEYDRRLNLLTTFDQHSSSREEGLFIAHRQMVAKTLEFSRSDYPKAFDLAEEPAAVRDAYGKTKVGNACLQARRLVEQGVAFVEINSSHWDMHSGIYSTGTTGIQAKTLELDQAISALVLDLETRGLLDQTLVVWMGEFGRTPELSRGAKPGRDHFSDAWSTLLIGGGLSGGQVVGRTDASGASVTDRPVTAADFLATVYQILGFDHRQELVAPGNRPMQLVDRLDQPDPIRDLL